MAGVPWQVPWQALALRQTDLGHAPGALDAVDMDRAPDELVLGVIDAEVTIAEIDKAVVPAPNVGVDNATWVDPTPNDPLQPGL